MKVIDEVDDYKTDVDSTLVEDMRSAIQQMEENERFYAELIDLDSKDSGLVEKVVKRSGEFFGTPQKSKRLKQRKGMSKSKAIHSYPAILDPSMLGEIDEILHEDDDNDGIMRKRQADSVDSTNQNDQVNGNGNNGPRRRMRKPQGQDGQNQKQEQGPRSGAGQAQRRQRKKQGDSQQVGTQQAVSQKGIPQQSGIPQQRSKPQLGNARASRINPGGKSSQFAGTGNAVTGKKQGKFRPDKTNSGQLANKGANQVRQNQNPHPALGRSQNGQRKFKPSQNTGQFGQKRGPGSERRAFKNNQPSGPQGLGKNTGRSNGDQVRKTPGMSKGRSQIQSLFANGLKTKKRDTSAMG